MQRSKLNQKTYCVYLMTNHTNSVIYTGISSKLKERIWEHKNKVVQGFTTKYNVTKLVYYEAYDDAYAAISREKQIKVGSRKKKIQLIESMNPNWGDLYEVI